MVVTVKELLKKFNLNINLPDFILELTFKENFVSCKKMYNEYLGEDYYELMNENNSQVISLSLPGKFGSLIYQRYYKGKYGPGICYYYNGSLSNIN